jgi:DNA-binding transcriptional regulator GbsR (MarR family)
MVAPFEGLLGDTSELRTIQFLLPVSGMRFNISELARETRISRQTMIRVVAKLTKWNVLKIAGRHGGANYYALNQDSGFIKAFEDLDNLIIEQMESEDSKMKMEAESREKCPVISALRPEGHELSAAAQIPQ